MENIFFFAVFANQLEKGVGLLRNKMNMYIICQVFYFEIINVICTSKFKDFVVIRMISEFHYLAVNWL